MSDRVAWAADLGRLLTRPQPLAHRLDAAAAALLALPGVDGALVRICGHTAVAGCTSDHPDLSLPLLVPSAEPGRLDVVGAGVAELHEELSVAASLLSLVASAAVSTPATASAASAAAPESALATAVAEAFLDSVITIDADGRVVDFNAAAERTFGYRREDVLGRRLADFLLPERMRVGHRKALGRFRREGTLRLAGQRLELPAVHADGHTVTVELTIAPATAGDRQLFVGLMRDITQERRAQQQLALSERRHRALVEHSPGIITVISPDGSWQTASAWLAEALRLPTSADNLGALLARAHPDDVGPATEYIERLLRGVAGGAGPELRMRAAAGDWRVMTMAGQSLLDEPAVNGVVLHSQDITSLVRTRSHLEATTTRLATLISALNAAVLLEDEQRHAVVANQAFVDMFSLGLPVDEVVGADGARIAERVAALFAEPSRFLASTSSALGDRKLRADEELLLADGRVLARDYVPVWADIGYLGHLWVYKDITDRKDYERWLAEQNEALAEIARLKTQLVSSVSHELRTPLSSVVGYTALLLEEDDPLTPDQRSFIEAVDRNAQRLLRLVGDLLMLTRLESDLVPLSVTELNAAGLARAVVADQAAESNQRGVVVATQTPEHVWVRGDAARLQQLLDNLLSNAIKFTASGGWVTISVSQPDPEHWRLIVDDNGRGVPAADLPRLFSTFYRAANVRELVPGTGLGLVICRAIVEQHGGEIAMTSTESEGTTVTATMPTAGPPTAPSPAPGPQDSHNSSPPGGLGALPGHNL